MSKMRWHILHISLSSIVLILCPTDGHASNILAAMPLPSFSHFKSFQTLFEELVRRGHNLTILGPFSLSSDFHGRYTFINMSHLSSKLDIVFSQMRQQNRLENLMFCSQRVFEYNEHVLKDPIVQRFITSKEDKFDLVFMEIFYMDVFVAFGYHFDAPIIALSAQGIISFYSWMFRTPMTSSYIPNMYLPFTQEMSVLQRLVNSFFNVATVLHHELVDLPRQQQQMETYFRFEKNGKQAPVLRELVANTAITLVNSHYTFGYPKPYLPNIIETAGLHLSEPKPLPNLLQKFMDNAEHGVIYISLGSLIEPSETKSVGNSFVTLLKHLPQRVIFKWNAELLEEVPENFFVQKWIPQDGVLKHPKCRLFITHGGFHSLVESVTYAVPLIGVPFFTDQIHNVALTEYLQIGRKMDLENMEQLLPKLVNEMLTNPRYQENIKRRSSLFSDRITSPLNTAVYWVEYVLRHKRGSELSQMKAASLSLHWYEYFLIDVIALSMVILAALIFVIYSMIRFSCKFVKSTKKSFVGAHVNKSSKFD